MILRKSIIGIIAVIGFILLVDLSDAFCGKIDPLLVAFREQQRNPNPRIDSVKGKEIISIPLPLDYLSQIMEISEKDGKTTAYTIIQTDGSFNEFQKYGIHVNARIGNIFTASLTMEQLDSLSKEPGIIRIEPSVFCKLNLDTSLTAMHVDSAVKAGPMTAGVQICDFCHFRVGGNPDFPPIGS